MDAVGGNVRRVARRDELELAPVILLQRGESLLAVDHLIEFDAIGPEAHLEEECGDGQLLMTDSTSNDFVVASHWSLSRW